VDAIQAEPVRVRDLVQPPGEYAFTVAAPSGEHRVRFWGDLPGGAGIEPALAVALIPAMAAGRTLELPSDPAPQLTRALPDIQGFLAHTAAVWSGDERALSGVDVVVTKPDDAAGDAPGRSAQGVAAFFSGGVDSWSTVLSHPDITDLIYVHGFDIPIDQAEVSSNVERRLQPVAEQLGKRFHIVRTDMRRLVDEAVLWDVSHGPGLAAVGQLFAPSCGRVLIGGSTPYSNLILRGSHPLHDHLWSTQSCQIEHDLAYKTRAEKVEQIAGCRPALEVLRVCWQRVDEYNCGRCEKCLRTMVALEALGALEACPTFDVALELEEVAELDVSDPAMRLWWEDNLNLARHHDAPRPLIDAIDACLESADRTMEDARTVDARLAEAEARVEALEGELATMRGSRSWRLGGPLRKAGVAARRISRRGVA
jgi:hypothetical protein